MKRSDRLEAARAQLDQELVARVLDLWSGSE